MKRKRGCHIISTRNKQPAHREFFKRKERVFFPIVCVCIVAFFTAFNPLIGLLFFLTRKLSACWMKRDTQTPKGDGVCGETTFCVGRKSHNSGGNLVPSERRRPPQKSRTQEGAGDMCPRPESRPLENGWPPRRVVEVGRAGRRCRSLPRHVARPDPPVPPLGFSRGAGPEIAEEQNSLVNGWLRTSGGSASGRWQGEASSPLQGLEGLMVGEQDYELMASLRSVSTDAGRSNPSLSVTKRPDQSEFKRLVGVGHSFCRETREQEKRDDDDNDAVVIAADDESVGNVVKQQGGKVTEKKMSSSKRIINGAVHSAHNERRATTVISSPAPTPRTPSAKVSTSPMAFTAPQETPSETASGTASPCVHNVGSGDFTSMGRYANQAHKTGFGDSNGPSSELVSKRGDKFAAMNGVVMDEANCDLGSGTRSSTPQQPQRFAPQQLPFAGGADFCSPVVYGDVSRDRAQNVGGSGGRPVAGMSTRASSQQQQQQQQQQHLHDVEHSSRCSWCFMLGSRTYSIFDAGFLKNMCHFFFLRENLMAVSYRMPVMSARLEKMVKQYEDLRLLRCHNGECHSHTHEDHSFLHDDTQEQQQQHHHHQCFNLPPDDAPERTNEDVSPPAPHSVAVAPTTSASCSLPHVDGVFSAAAFAATQPQGFGDVAGRLFQLMVQHNSADAAATAGELRAAVSPEQWPEVVARARSMFAFFKKKSANVGG